MLLLVTEVNNHVIVTTPKTKVFWQCILYKVHINTHKIWIDQRTLPPSPFSSFARNVLKRNLILFFFKCHMRSTFFDMNEEAVKNNFKRKESHAYVFLWVVLFIFFTLNLYK